MDYTVNTLFGDYRIRDAGVNLRSNNRNTTINENQVKDKLARESQIYKEIYKNDAYNAFLTNPNDYMEARKAAATAVETKVRDNVKNAMKEYLKYGYTQKESFDLAMKDTRRENSAVTETIEKMYPIPNNLRKK